MAITLKGGPQAFTPGYNEVNYYIDSTNKNKKGFKYVVDVYNAAAVKVKEFRVSPRPGDGYGEVKLRGRLAEFLGYDVSVTSADGDAENSYFAYSAKFGEEYATLYDLDSGATMFNTGGNVTITTTGATAYVVGDSIVVDAPTNGIFAAVCLVVSVSGLEIVTSIPWDDSYDDFDQDEDGVTFFADERKTVVRDLLVSSGQVWNGALTNSAFRTYDQDDYILTSTGITGKLLTSMPEYGITIGRSQPYWLNCANNLRDDVYCYFTNDTGDVFRKLITPDATAYVTRFGVGTGNLGTLELISGTAPLIKPATAFYEVDLRDDTAAEVTQLYHFDIDDRCNVSDFMIAFIDRLGSMPTVAMKGRGYESQESTKTTYQKRLGDLVGTKWDYSLTDRGTKMIAASEREIFDLNTLPITQEESDYLAEALSSPEVFMYWNGEWHSVDVMDTTAAREKKNNRTILTRKMKVKLSNENNVNV